MLAVLLAFFLAQAAAQVPEHLKEAAALADKGEYREAAAKLANVPESLPGVLHLRGVIHYNLREHADAIRALESAVQSEKPGTPAWRESALLIGQSYFLTSKYAKAVPWLEKVAGASTPETHYMLGVSRIHTSHPEAAVEAFARLFALEPKSAAAHLLAAQLMYRFEFHDQAEAMLRKALAIDPRLPGAHHILGELATYRNDTERAVAELHAELAVNPGSATAYYKLGDAWSRREDWDKAIPALQKSIWLSPFNSGPYILLGKGYLKRQDYPNAEGMLRRALQMDPNNASAHYLLGQTLVRAGKAEEGRRMLDRWQKLQAAPTQ